MNEGGEVRGIGLEHEVKVIGLLPERVQTLRKDLLRMGAQKTFEGEIENIRVDTDGRLLADNGINARIRRYTSKKADGTELVQFEWTVKRKVKRAKFKSREESKGVLVSTYEESLASLTAFVSELVGEPVQGLHELWRVKKYREMHVFPKGHSLYGAEIVIDKLKEVSIDGVMRQGSTPTEEIPHYMEIESSTGDDAVDDFNITECGSMLGVDIGGELHDASERELLEHYGFLPKKA